MKRHRYAASFSTLALMLAAAGLSPSTAKAEECSNGSFSSTFELIQKAVFETYSCSNQICHGSTVASGGLDLSPERAYDELIEQPAETVAGWKRVVPGRRDESLLYINLAAKTHAGQVVAPLRAMPPDPIPALTANQLEAVRRWIEGGAPRDGVVPGTAELLDACLPPPRPIEIRPLDPPPPGTGVQIRMPRYVLAPRSERETCFASYYDVTDQVPAEFVSPDGQSFRYRKNTIRQDPLSHHLIVTKYTGEASPTDPSWGRFNCRGGERDGESCVPTDLTFCGEGLCSTTPRNSIACIGFGPQDVESGLANAGFTGTQETASDFNFPDGVYGELPLRGMIIWNSHAFNLTDEPGKLEAWLNFEFAPPASQLLPARQIFDAGSIFGMEVPAFQTQEICRHHRMVRGTRVFELSSHGHSRMKRWRTFLGQFACEGGPANGQACSPLGYDFASPDVCRGRPCKAMVRARVGDCDTNGEVTVNELVQAVNIALGATGITSCGEADVDIDGQVTVNEIVRAVSAALNGIPEPTELDPWDNLLYVSLIYNDPIVLPFSPPMSFDSTRPDERTFTFCALYDNGFTNPEEVKRKSTSPTPPVNVPGINVGGPCATPTHCTAGQVGAPCSGANATLRNASCDSAPGAGDGFCDACTLRGGVTTEDEMYILMGQYYVTPMEP